MRPLAVVAVVAFLASIALAAPDDLFTADTLPPGWTVREVVEVPAGQLAGFGQRLGGEVVYLANQHLSLAGFPAQLNAIRGADEAAATAIEKTLLAARGEDYVTRRGAVVYEVAGNNVLVARRVFDALGVRSHEKAIWRVRVRLALVDALVESERNDVFNLFLRREKNPDDASLDAAIREAVSDWTFGRRLRLRAWAPPVTLVSATFVPEPVATEDEGPSRVYVFEDPPAIDGVPYVDLDAVLEVHAAFAPRPGAAAPSLTAATTRWPAEPVAAVAAAAVEGAPTPRARVRALLGALGARVRHGGQVGSRDPVPEVLARGYGHCFDRSDVFVAACRSQGIPARILAGWVPPLGAGHVWTEVFLEGDGWLPVDATTTWLGTSSDYIPLFASETGPMPFLYLGWPRIERR